MTPLAKINIALFVSGEGTNCENIIRYFIPVPDINVSLVISNKSDVYALIRATKLGVNTVVITRQNLEDEAFMTTLLEGNEINFIVLAGFLLMIPPYLTHRFRNRIINIHPSLLPRHGGKGMYGINVHKAVKESGDPVTGITIHQINDVCDGGNILFQASVTISSEDSPEDICAKVHSLEMEYYPRIIEKTARETLQIVLNN